MRSTLGAGKVSLRKVGVGGGGDLVGCECDMVVFGSKTQGELYVGKTKHGDLFRAFYWNPRQPNQ